MLQKFVEAGYEAVDFEEKADIYIINTCTVTNISDKKSRQIIRRAKHTNKNAIVAAVGCYAQVAKDKLEDIPEIDLVLGTSEKNNIVKFKMVAIGFVHIALFHMQEEESEAEK